MHPVFDPDQQTVLDAPTDRPLLVTGEAGTGKTTVALERVRRQARPRDRVAILLPTDSLANQVLSRVRRVPGDVWVGRTEAWLRARAEEAVGAPLAAGEEVPSAAVVAKRHPVMPSLLDFVASPLGRELLHEVWGDEGLLDEAVWSSEGELSPSDADAILAYARVQHAELPRDDAGRVLRGMDGPVHHGTPLHDAGTVDRGDLGLLLAEARRTAARLTSWSHIVVDEAQELSPTEVAAVAAAVRPGGTLTWVGDGDQQLDPGAWFRGWAAPRAEGLLHEVVLRHGHRCPAAVLAVARAVRDGRPVPRVGVWHRWARPEDRRRALHDAPAGAVLVAHDAARARALARQLGRAVVDPASLRGREVPWVILPDLSDDGWPATSAGRRALYLAMTRATRGLWCGAVGAYGAVVATAQ